MLPDTLFERARTLFVIVWWGNDETTEGCIQAPLKGGLLHCRSAKKLASVGVKDRPSGRPASGLDTDSSLRTITFDSILSLNNRGAQHRAVLGGC